MKGECLSTREIEEFEQMITDDEIGDLSLRSAACLIATIRDRDRQIAYWKGHEVIQILNDQVYKARQQNTIIHEALEKIAKFHVEGIDQHQLLEALEFVSKTVNDSLAKLEAPHGV